MKYKLTAYYFSETEKENRYIFSIEAKTKEVIIKAMLHFNSYKFTLEEIKCDQK